MMIKVESSDGMVFELDQKAAEQSFFINETIQYCIEQVNTIKIPNINGKILSMIVNFCRKHAETVDFIELQSWDDEFIKDYNTDDIFDLISVSQISTYRFISSKNLIIICIFFFSFFFPLVIRLMDLEISRLNLVLCFSLNDDDDDDVN